MSLILSEALRIPPTNIKPFHEWVKLVRHSPLSENENPASRLIDFLENNFERMSCGGLMLDTKNSKEHSETMRLAGPVSGDVARGYIKAWKRMGFLAP